ncbi:alpha-ketoglutarate dehydrogenase component 4-like [Littorina saxatilis]|uniref:Mitochondrial ribosomal protein S36 n=1 Tax=Littorina saxatilis TaxID=31220 RepID=A0AAN9C367_9CAEN
MATIAVRTLKTVRPHIPMIKFPPRGKVPAYNPSASSTPATTAAPSTAAAQSKAVGSTPRGSGIDELALPQKYLRRAIDPEEMEYIERGGPA